MSEIVKLEEGVISFWTLGKIFFLSGIVSTLIASPFYAWKQWETLSVSTWGLLFVLAPIANGFISLLFLLVTFPIYRWMATKNLFNFREVQFKDGSSGDL